MGLRIPFADLTRQHRPFVPGMERAFRKLLRRSDFILGGEVAAFEREFARFCGTRRAIGTASGIDALTLILAGFGIGRGDEVIVPAFTFGATAFAVSHVGATPVFADVDPVTFNLDPGSAARAVTRRTRAILPVHLFGQPADMDALDVVARRRRLFVVEDACQAHGARWRGRPAGSLGRAAAFSFYPSKNLGAAGDAGAVTTSDAALDRRIRILRNVGQDGRYAYAAAGYNSRLDTLQAAILRIKLRRLARWNGRRRAIAALYGRLLRGSGAILPEERPGARHVWHQYVIRTPRRDAVRRALETAGIASSIFYPGPLHLQRCYRDLGYRRGDCPAAERLCREVLALPIHPEMTDAQVRRVARAVHG